MIGVAAAATLPATAAAQTPGPMNPGEGRWAVTAGYEVHRDRFHYTFANPSSIDTDFLVPHTFTQSYVADNQWLVVAARFSIAGNHGEAEIGFTPQRQTAGSDLDTFHDPGGDVVVSGTAGDVRMQSRRASFWGEGRLLGLSWRAGYRFRRDRSQFLPTDRIVTHTRPPSEARSPTYGRETTTSTVQEVPIDLSGKAALTRNWSVVAGGSASPIVWGRLTTLLPDKYPGQSIVFDAPAFGAGGRVQLVRRSGGWPLVLTAEYSRTWSYSAERQFSRNDVRLSAQVAFEH